MALEPKQSTVNTFTKGLITEASTLTYPVDSSVDELNCDLLRSGCRIRRKSIQLESGGSGSSFSVASGQLVFSQDWPNVSNIPGTEFLVVQVGSTLYFYDKSSAPVSGGEKSFNVDLTTFSAGNGKPPSAHRISTASISGNLVVVSPAINPFYIEYDPDADTITTTAITAKVRDFDWQDDTSEYYKDAVYGSMSEERKYDTLNAGWVETQQLPSGAVSVLPKFRSKNKFPRLTHPWFSGKGTTGKFDINQWESIGAGNTLIGNGHYILDLFRKDRTQAVLDDPLNTESISLPIETDNTRFSAVGRYAGRIWFAGLSSKKNSSRIFFSPVIRNMRTIGNFYQEGDPTSEETPDLVDSDGGVINIPSAVNIKALFEWGNNLLVFAENGVWQISGPDGVFSATEFFVSRVNATDGIANPATLINAEGIPIWWGPTGIFTLTEEAITGESSGQDLTKATIQTFWDDIGAAQRDKAVGVYDPANKRAYWVYGNSATDYKYNRVLVLDIPLKAFFPWEFEDESTLDNYVVGASYFTGFGTVSSVQDVFADGDDIVSNSGTDDVVATIDEASVVGPRNIRFLVRSDLGSTLKFAQTDGTDFLDWGTADYESFAEAAYDFDDDLSLRKHGIFTTCYFKRTETEFATVYTEGTEMLVATACVAATTTDGNQDITITDLGWTPKAAKIVYCANAGVSGADNVGGSIGVTDGTTQWVSSFLRENNSSERTVQQYSDSIIIGLNPGGSFVDQEASFVSFIPNGIRVNWSSAPANADRLMVTFFGGDNFQAKAGVISGASGATVQETIGFEAEGGFFVSADNVDFDGQVPLVTGIGSLSYFILSYGLLGNTNPNLGVQQYHLSWRNERFPIGHPEAGHHTRQQLDTSKIARYFTISDIDSTSLSVDIDPFLPVAPYLENGNTFYLGYLVFNTVDGNVILDVIDSPTSTGAYSTTSPGFTPDYMEMINTLHTSVDVLQDDVDDAESVSFTTIGATGGLASGAFWVENRRAESVGAERWSECQSLNVHAPGGDGGTNWSNAFEGTFTEMTSAGATLNMTTVDGTTRKWAAMFVG